MLVAVRPDGEIRQRHVPAMPLAAGSRQCQNSFDMRCLRWLVLAFVAAGPLAAAAPADAPALRPGEFFYQFRDQVVLWNDASTRWGRGAFRLEAVPDDRHEYVIASRAVEVRRLPRVLSRWRGRVLRLYNFDGSSCTAKVTGFRLVGVALLVPPLATKWHSLLDPRKGDPATGGEGWQQQSAMAEAAWNHGARLLVATLDRQDGCAAQAWARAAELPAPALALHEPVDASLRQLAVEAFHALPAWQRLQELFARAPDRRGQPDPAWDRKDHAQPHVQLFRLRPSSGGVERRFVSVLAVHDHPDAALDRRLWAIFELDSLADRPTLLLRVLASGPVVPAGLEPYLIVDFHDDGRLAFLHGSEAGNGLMLEADGAFVDRPAARAPR